MGWCLVLMFCCLVFTESRAQHQQVWFDYQLDYPFASQYLFEMTASYQTQLTNRDQWRSFNISPSLEYQYFTSLDIIFSAPVSYTFQTETYNTFGADPSVGARFHITQNKRVNTNVTYKLEQRFLKNIDDNSWESSNRSRLKGEIRVAINGPNLYHDKLWYAIADYEEFFVTDKQVDERYANRRRGRLGAGYRLSYRDRFELLYTWQSSRNEIEGDFISNDYVIQFRYKMYLNAARPKPATTTDD